jgi:NADPH2:quinone reductase
MSCTDVSMKAVTYADFGGPEVLELVSLPRPRVRSTDLLVRVHAAGVNKADLNQRRGAYGKGTDFGDSTLMGLEIAGEVVELGPDVHGFRPGDRVMGITGGGGYAEFARMDYRLAMPIPPTLSYVDAAAIPEVFVTAHQALFHLGELRAGESVLIHGAAGGVGTASLQLAAAISPGKVFATAAREQHEALKALGASMLIDYRNADFQRELMDAGIGVDLIIDIVGGPNLQKNVRSLNAGGRLIQLGIQGGTEGQLPMDVLLFKRLRIIGTVMKSLTVDEKHAMVNRFRYRWTEALAGGAIRAVVDSVYPLREASLAHRRMEAGQHLGKIILQT